MGKTFRVLVPTNHMGIRVPNLEFDSNGMKFEQAYIAVSTNAFMMTPSQDKQSFEIVSRYSIWYSHEARTQGKAPVETLQLVASSSNPVTLNDLYESVYSRIKEQYPLGVDDQEIANAAPVVETSNATPVVETSNSAPVVETSNSAPVVETSNAAPVVETSNAAPVVETSNAAPVVETSNSAPVVETSNSAPVVETSNAAPVVETSNSAPVDQVAP